MKAITITIEDLSNGNIRATGRHNGSTVAWKDGAKGTEKQILSEVMDKTAGAHRFEDGSYDLTHINLNDAAKEAMA